MVREKAFWTAIADNQYRPPVGYSVADLTPELYSYLGSPDAELRDAIAVEILTNWIIGGYYSADELRRLMGQWVENLGYRIGATGDDTVLLRSFSALMLSIIAYHDWKESFLTAAEVHSLLDAALAYFAAEQDERGYVEGRGWLHSPAHTADLLKFLARNPHTTAEHHARVLDGLARKVTRPRRDVFVHSEYERLGWVALDLVKRESLDEARWQAWVDDLVAVKAEEPNSGYSFAYHAQYQNTKHFLRSVYFILAYDEQPIALSVSVQQMVFEALKHFRT